MVPERFEPYEGKKDPWWEECGAILGEQWGVAGKGINVEGVSGGV